MNFIALKSRDDRSLVLDLLLKTFNSILWRIRKKSLMFKSYFVHQSKLKFYYHVRAENSKFIIFFSKISQNHILKNVCLEFENFRNYYLKSFPCLKFYFTVI